MSLKIHRQVMNISRRNGFDLSLKAWALLIAMTDRADDGGNSIYASIPNLGTTARLNKRTALNLIFSPQQATTCVSLYML